MIRLAFRGSIVAAVAVVALVSSGRAEAQQVVTDSGTSRHPGSLVDEVVTGVEYDRLNKAKAERQLQHLQAKTRRDAERCKAEALDRDARRSDRLRYRIAVDCWLIRMNSLQDPGYYPIRNP